MTGSYDDVIGQVSEMLATALLEGDVRLEALDADADVHRLLRRVGLQTTQRLVEAETERVLADAAARGFTVTRSAEVGVDCLYGRLRVYSPYLRRSNNDKARPVRDLGLIHRAKTPALERALTDFGIEDSFGLAASRFEEHYGWRIHRTSLLRVVHGAAAEALTFVEKKLAEEPASVESAACLLVEMDGCELPTGVTGSPDPVKRTPIRGLPVRKRPLMYRDVRLAFVRELPKDSEKTFVGGMSPFSEVVEQLHSAARHRGLTKTTVVATVVDGGNGLREAIEGRFGQCIVVLDRPHMSEHLHDVAKNIGLQDKERFAWVSRVLEDFYRGRVAQVYAELDAYQGPGRERVVRFLKHLWRFQDAVDYGNAHGWGIPQGSGEIESAHRYIPQKRLKIAGACWHPDSMNKILAMRLVRANGWWDDFWTTRRQRTRAQEAA